MQHSTQHAALRTTGGLAVVLAVVIAALCAVPAVGQFGADYRVGQGDVLEVYVYNEAELTQSYPVGPGGGITLPMVGRVQVIGNTTDEIRELLRKRLSEVIVNPFVTVSIDEAKSLRKVFVSGYVATKGPMMVPPNGSVRDAVITAGPEPRADLSQVRLTREGQPPLVIDLSGLTMDTPLGDPVPVEYGDVIYVPRIDDVISVLGEVNEPGALVLPAGEELNVLQAIAQVGKGFGPEADENSAMLFRKGLDAPIDINLRALLKDGDIAQNLELRGGDVLLVRKTDVIAVIGYVNNPVTFYSSEPVDLTEAIIRAGGFNETSDLKNARIYGEGKYTPVDLQKLWAHGELEGNVKLHAGETLIVPEKQPEDIIVLGAVEKKGAYNIALMKGATLLRMVQMAVPTEKADMRKVQLHRAGSEPVLVNLDTMEKTGDVSNDILLQAGDVIVVNEADKVYLIGAFGKPGIYPFDPEKSVFDYITDAQLGLGFGHSVGSLVRLDENGETQVTELDLSKLKRGQLPVNVDVQPGDIIYFPPVVRKESKTIWQYLREALWIVDIFGNF